MDQVNQNNDGKINEIITEIPAAEKSRLTMQAKVFFFCSATGEILNIEDYEEWRTNKSEQVQEPEYSSNYQEIVKLILEGKEVPGIKQIPDTVLEGETSESKVGERRKPWEIATEEEREEEQVAAQLQEDVVEESEAVQAAI